MKKISILITLLAMTVMSVGAQESKYLLNIPHSEDVKTLSKEDVFVDSIFPTIPMYKWDKTTKFMFPKNVLDESDIDISSSFKYDESFNSRDLWGKIVTVDRIYEKKVRCPRGRCLRTCIDFVCEGHIFTYEYIYSMEKLADESTTFKTVDLVYLGDIDIVKDKMIGMCLYSTNTCFGIPVEKDNNKDSFLQYAKYEVVDAGTSMVSTYPVRLFLRGENGDNFYVDMVLSKTNQPKISSNFSYIKYPYTFQENFTFDNPRDKYPDISDETWKHIQRRIAKIGMTKKECRLALGIPKSKNTDINSNGVTFEQWVYHSMYVYFKDGRISYIQNR